MSNLNRMPIIRLEVERMKYAMQHALVEHAALMDDAIQKAIEAYCTPENIDAIVRKEATHAIDSAVREEVRAFFSQTGAGRKAVREAVTNWLNDVYPEAD